MLVLIQYPFPVQVQYRFIHHALVEYFSYDTTEVLVNDLRQYIAMLKTSRTDEIAGDMEFQVRQPIK